jgi:hypothetical protein
MLEAYPRLVRDTRDRVADLPELAILEVLENLVRRQRTPFHAWWSIEGRNWCNVSERCSTQLYVRVNQKRWFGRDS